MDVGDRNELASVGRHALETFGEETQINVAIEELAELVVALQHYRRGKCDARDVRMEIADVEIVVDQLKQIFDRDAVTGCTRFKLSRLKSKLFETRKAREK